MLTAITKAVAESIVNCELTHMDRQAIDYKTACAQHQAYNQALKDLGVDVIQLEADNSHPDSVFVEDAAVVLDEVAIITRPGAVSRQGEISAIKQALSSYRECIEIQAPATLDGGDVLVAGKRIFIGLSTRSNQAAVEQLQHALQAYGYQVQGIETAKCLHLKTAVTQLSDTTLLINPDWLDPSYFNEFDLIACDPSEPFGANVLKVGDTLIAQPSFPKTVTKLKNAGFKVVEVDNSELAKAEAGLTCCSLVFKS